MKMIKLKSYFQYFIDRCIEYKDYIFVGIFFLCIAIILTDFTIFNPDKRVFTTGIGDGTSGFTWIVYATQGLHFFTDTTTLINYPFGENLWSPVYVTWLLVLGPFWLLSRIISPIAAGNVMLLIGFVSTALMGYWGVKRIAHSRSIGFIGGYAIAFVPYHVAKGSDHLTNIYAWVFVAIIVSFIAFWRVPNWRRGLLLALSVAAACYTDGYFIYVTAALLIGLFGAQIVTDLSLGKNIRQFKNKVLRLGGVGIISLVLLAPIFWVQISASKAITKDLANSRDNPRLEVSYYAARPLDFLLPPTGNITVSQYDWYQSLRERKNGHSNDTESTNYIGYVVLALYASGVVLFGKYVVQSRQSKNKEDRIPLDWQVLGVTLIAVPLVLVWMLPPVSHIGPLKVVMPAYFMAEYLPYWRVPARVFLALHPLMVIAAMISLSFLIKNLRGRRRYILLSVILLVVGIEYFSTLKHPSFSTYKMPTTYSWLRDQKDIRAIAEVPIVDRPIEVAGYYVFAQLIHGKPIINTSLSKTAIGLFNPLGDIDNPETINLIKSRSVDAVVTHEESCEQKDWGALIHSENGTLPPPYTGSSRTSTCVYRLNDKTPIDNLFVFAKDGFAKTDFLDSNGKYWVAADRDVVTIESTSSSGNPSKDGRALFEATVGTLGDFKKKPISWRVMQNDKVVASTRSGDSSGKISVEINSSERFTIQLRVNSFEKPAPGELGFSQMQLIAK